MRQRQKNPRQAHLLRIFLKRSGGERDQMLRIFLKKVREMTDPLPINLAFVKKESGKIRGIFFFCTTKFEKKESKMESARREFSPSRTNCSLKKPFALLHLGKGNWESDFRKIGTSISCTSPPYIRRPTFFKKRSNDKKVPVFLSLANGQIRIGDRKKNFFR